MYRNLDADKTLATIELLERRIGERFPDAGLHRVCAELRTIATESKARTEWIARPNRLLRGAVVLVLTLLLAVLGYSLSLLEFSLTDITATELVQALDAVMNEIVLIGAAVFFLVSGERRIKRARALGALHELRSIAHVIDMHQLTKDPGRLRGDRTSTPSSPVRVMTAFELTRYLDYCSEMLSLTGKLAALYAQGLNDDVVLGAVNEVETLTTALSRKIWQKIVILERLQGEDG
ncbi:MAG: hypothetical protein KDK06_20630 [Gammaproteobacteria bacterium]|nr:hypothetical protein [Gammaproteobacteria bacterium]